MAAPTRSLLARLTSVPESQASAFWLASRCPARPGTELVKVRRTPSRCTWICHRCCVSIHFAVFVLSFATKKPPLGCTCQSPPKRGIILVSVQYRPLGELFYSIPCRCQPVGDFLLYRCVIASFSDILVSSLSFLATFAPLYILVSINVMTQSSFCDDL